MSGPGDIGGEVSGDEAAWRDLVARFDVPTDRTTTVVPWPAIEDLAERPSAAGTRARTDEPPASPPEPAARPADGDHRTTQPDRGTNGSSRSAVDPARPTASPSGPVADTTGRAADTSGRAADTTSRAADATDRSSDPAAGTTDSPDATDQAAGPATSFAIPLDRTRVIRPAGLPRSYSPPAEDEEQYVPAPLPPPGKLDTTSKAALAGVVGGPGYLLVASIFLHWTISAEAALVAVAAFVGGFVTLIVKLGDRSGRDDDDDGAVL